MSGNVEAIEGAEQTASDMRGSSLPSTIRGLSDSRGADVALTNTPVLTLSTMKEPLVTHQTPSCGSGCPKVQLPTKRFDCILTMP